MERKTVDNNSFSSFNDRDRIWSVCDQLLFLQSMILTKKYPFQKTARHTWLVSLGIGLFVFLFLYLLLPFGLGQIPSDERMLKIGIYGFISFALNALFLFVADRMFEESTWVVWKEILMVSCLVLTIAVGNYIYTSIIFPQTPLSLRQLFSFIVFTLGIGIIPITIIILVNQIVLYKRNYQEAVRVNEQIHDKEPTPKVQSLIQLQGQYQDHISIDPADLIFIESKANYLYAFTNDGKTHKLRSTLKHMEAQLEQYPFLKKTHRAFIVNLNKIKNATGNAQGLQLSLHDHPTQIPVARSQVKNFRDLISHK